MNDRIRWVAKKLAEEAVGTFISTIAETAPGYYIFGYKLSNYLWQRYAWATERITNRVYKVLMEQMVLSNKNNNNIKEDFVKMGD
jgi:hypothetical protein